MKLKLENGNVINNPSNDEIAMALKKELALNGFAILSIDEMTYLQAAVGKGVFFIEYQEGSIDLHYNSKNKLPLDQTDILFQKYANNDISWQTLAEWEPSNLNQTVKLDIDKLLFQNEENESS